MRSWSQCRLAKLHLSRGESIALALLLAFALLLRLAYVLLFGPSTYSWDGRVYDQIAHNILNGTGFNYAPGFNESFRPPLYPFFLAGIYKTLGSSIVVVRAVQAVLGVISCLAVYVAGRRVGGRALGLLAIAILVFDPWAIWYTREVLAETLFTLLLLLGVLCVLLLRERHSWRIGIVAGLLFGLAALTRPLALLIPVISAFWLMAPFSSRVHRQVVPVVAMLLALVVAITPWTVRNYLIHHRIVPIATEGGYTFYAGNRPGISDVALHKQSDVDQIFLVSPTEEEETTLSTLSEVEKEDQFYRWAFQFIRKQPGRFLHLFKEKLLLFWSPSREVPLSRFDNLTHGNSAAALVIRNLVIASQVALFVLAAVGLIAGILSKRRWHLLMLLLLLYFTAVYALYFPQLRYRVPLSPYLALLAASGLLSLLATLRASLAALSNLPRTKLREPGGAGGTA
ncbi:MAG: glycosyltransferase family 39 protein [Chloroflexi bacterium]|nr:glycosyltransferase family 39 protein [Chloroflexota bacterium]